MAQRRVRTSDGRRWFHVDGARRSAAMRRRVGWSAMLAVVGLIAASCSFISAGSDEMTSAPRPPRDSRSGNFDPGLPDIGDIDDFGDLSDKLNEITGGMGELDDCMTLSLAFVQLPFIAFSANGPKATKQIETIIDELRSQVPRDLRDELETVGDVYVEAASGDGILDAAGAMSEPGFTDANEAIGEWLASQCTGEGAAVPD